jgi:cytidylate kinase
MELKFDNIAISGGIGVGTTTLLKNLKPYLEPQGFTFTSMGQLIREKMNEFKNPVAELVSDDFDRDVESGMYDKFKNGKGILIEAWLAGFMARELPNTLRVLLYCSEDAIRIDRIVNREGVGIEEAKKLIKEREDTNLTKWKRLYGDYDFWNPTYYHLMIDTYSSGPMETVGKVLDKLGYVE